MITKTKCLSCNAGFEKDLFLFSFCPNCKGTNLKEVLK